MRIDDNLNKKSFNQTFCHDSIFQGLGDTLYFKNPAAKVKVEGLRLLEASIPGLRDQVRSGVTPIFRV